MPKTNFFPEKIYSLLESLREDGLFKASWNSSIEKFSWGQSLFQLKLNDHAIEVEANHFTNHISISTGLEFFIVIEDLSKLSEMKKKFPHLHFEYRHYQDGHIYLKCCRIYEFDNISNTNDLKGTLKSISNETLKVKEYVSNFTGKCKTWENRDSLHMNRLLHGFGVKSL